MKWAGGEPAHTERATFWGGMAFLAVFFVVGYIEPITDLILRALGGR